MASEVRLKSANGITYVYENQSYWDKATKSTKHKRKLIGHVDPETGKVVPNRKKGDTAKKRALAKDMVEDGFTVRPVGLAMLLDKAVKDIQLQEVLTAIFPKDRGHILACAYHILYGDNTLSYIDNNMVFGSNDLTDYHDIGCLLTRITPDLREVFFQKWMECNPSDRLYVMNITGVASYSGLIEAQNSENSYGIDCPGFINMLMVIDKKSSMPVFYRIIPNRIKSLTELNKIMAASPYTKGKRLYYVLDKDIYNENIIGALSSSRQSFIMDIPVKSDYSTELIKRHIDNVFSETGTSVMGADNSLYIEREDTSINGCPIYNYVCYDRHKGVVSERSSSKVIVDQYDRMRSGLSVFTGTIKTDNSEPLALYRMKSDIGEFFSFLDNELDRERIPLYSREAMEGRVFLQFVAQLIAARLNRVLYETDGGNVHNFREAINGMKSLYEVRSKGSGRAYQTDPTPLQREIMELYDL